jgi:uncharacterized protein YecE (DUF72 family)
MGATGMVRSWAARVGSWARGEDPEGAEKIVKDAQVSADARDVFVYFDNDVKVRAPFDAQQLAARVDKVLR